LYLFGRIIGSKYIGIMVKDMAVNLHEYFSIMLKTYRSKWPLYSKLSTSPYQIVIGVVTNNIKL
jgi:hypothetical protein